MMEYIVDWVEVTGNRLVVKADSKQEALHLAELFTGGDSVPYLEHEFRFSETEDFTIQEVDDATE